MASFLDALNAGSSMAEVGIASYDRAKEWSAKLQAAAEAHEEKAAEFKTKAAQVGREQTETERHNKATEAQWAPGSRGHGLTGKSPDDKLGADLWKSVHELGQRRKDLINSGADPAEVSKIDERLNIANSDWDGYIEHRVTGAPLKLTKHAAPKSSGLPGLE